MKKILITLIVSILGIIYCYQYTFMYLFFNSNDALVIKIREGNFNRIQFLTALNAINESNSNEYDNFLLEILKQKEKLDEPICKKCYLTINSYANEILNKKYKGKNIVYLSYFNIMSEIRDQNIKLNLNTKTQLIRLIDNFDENKEKILEIIKKNNAESINQWEMIINP